jgi:hypothetical protein
MKRYSSVNLTGILYYRLALTGSAAFRHWYIRNKAEKEATPGRMTWGDSS